MFCDKIKGKPFSNAVHDISSIIVHVIMIRVAQVTDYQVAAITPGRFLSLSHNNNSMRFLLLVAITDESHHYLANVDTAYPCRIH